MQARVHSIETFGTVDGPGIRYVLFLKGCPFRCLYCHNPDTWDMTKGSLMTVDEVSRDLKKYSRYVDGITISGGEPLLQLDFVTELFKKVKQDGFSTCLDTSGAIFNEKDENLKRKLLECLKFCDLVMLDIKHIDENKHKMLTGHSNKNVLDFARFLSAKNIDVWLRYVLVPTINDDQESLGKWREFKDTLTNVKKVELLPYHTLAIPKYEELGIEYKLKGIAEPSKEQIKKAKEILGIGEDL